MPDDLTAFARDRLATSRYLTLATAGADGRPWASPVWFAAPTPHELLWVSRPEARHSRNVAARPEVGIVVFDSHVEPGTGAAIYAEALAEGLTDHPELPDRVAALSRVSEEQGMPAWSPADVRAPAPLRLYRARVTAWWALPPGAGDVRVPVDL